MLGVITVELSPALVVQICRYDDSTLCLTPNIQIFVYVAQIYGFPIRKIVSV